MFIDENMKHQYNLKVRKIFLNRAEQMPILRGNY